jgi:hypothetical protein
MYCYGGYKFLPLKIHNKKAFKNKKMSFKTLKDGYKLEFFNDNWSWSKLPNMPISMSGFGMTSYGEYIYICCGAHRKDYFVCTQLMVEFNGKKCGDILYRLNINNLNKGWEIYDYFPGTLRFNPAMTCINGNIYILGGIYPNHNWVVSKNIKNRFYNVLDNWVYNIEKKEWTQLNVCINNYFGNWGCSTDRIVYKDRYIILIGGYGYGYTIFDNNKKINPYYTGKFTNCVHVYDIKTNVCYKTNSLFCDINVPDYLINGDLIYLVGGESIPYKYKGEIFGRHSDIFAIGKIDFIN